MMRWLVLVLLLLAAPAVGQSRAAPKRFTQDDLKRAEADRDAAVSRLRAIEAKSAAVARAVSDIDADLLAAGADATSREEAAYAAEERLMILADETRTAASALSSDQAALEDLLAALMSFGARRPPAIIANPDDSSAAVRAAILMSDAAPALASRADGLREQLAQLDRLAAETRAQQANLLSATGALDARRTEIAALAEEKRRAMAALDAEAATARATVNRLAGEAQTLRGLLDGLARAAPPAPSAKPGSKTSASGKPSGKPAAATAPAPARPPASKPAASASAPLQPVVGSRLRAFGRTVNGETQEGLTLSTRPAATVIAPLDARVQYSGPFRTYGLMVILDVGGGVLVVLSGLESLFPEAGQWVLAGEPIGRMADRKSPSPELYLEVRRSGQPVDPEKWLAQRS